MKEAAIQSKILDYLKTVTGCWAVKIVECNRRGCPDILVCRYGIFYAFEVKSDEGSKLSVLQQAQGTLIKRAGGDFHVVTSVDQVKEIINND